VKSKNITLDDCFFVLGDMNELGDFSEKFHGEIGEYLKESGVKNVCFIGRFRDFYLKTFTSGAQGFLTKDEFKDEWISARKKYKYIFIKASRSLQLETLLNLK
jgi:UDP-N-acetylmuramoyl-tripeptide--D-alanyl-D-alanine ligase